jgi:hypothetical protein
MKRLLASMLLCLAAMGAYAQSSSDSITVTLTVNTYVNISFYSHTAISWVNSDGGTTSSYTTTPLKYHYLTNANATVKSSLTPVGPGGGLTYSSQVSSTGATYGPSFSVLAGTSADGFVKATISGLSLNTAPSTYNSTLTILITSP